MTAKRYVILKGEDVVNVILWDSAEEYECPEDCTLRRAPDRVGPGWKYVDEEWIAPVIEIDPNLTPTEDPEVLAAKNAAVEELMSNGYTETTARLLVGLPLQP